MELFRSSSNLCVFTCMIICHIQSALPENFHFGTKLLLPKIKMNRKLITKYDDRDGRGFYVEVMAAHTDGKLSNAQ